MRSIIFTCLFSFVTIILSANEDAKLNEVKIAIELKCPMSPELQNLIDVVPQTNDQEITYEDWSQSFIINMQKLIELVESGKMGNASFSISIDTCQPADQQP
jgi:hypothetical protein